MARTELDNGRYLGAGAGIEPFKIELVKRSWAWPNDEGVFITGFMSGLILGATLASAISFLMIAH